MATSFHALQSGFGDGLAALDADNEEGAALRSRLGAALVSGLGAEFRTMGLQLGYRYAGSPICIDDGGEAPPDDPEVYRPAANPGLRAPHFWLRDGRSILDEFGRGFTLLSFGGAEDDAARLEHESRRRGVPLRLVSIDDRDAAMLYQRRFVLVRPDGHVAWRGDAVPRDPQTIIDRVRGAR
jgi:hypothetical protein